jgi:adenylosuccinate lyase
MELSPLSAISPVDGRYRKVCAQLAEYFSEAALIKYRVMVEIEYFISLCELPLAQLFEFDHKDFKALRDIYKHFNEKNAAEIKEIECTTNHDVKAVEYFLKKKFDEIQTLHATSLHEYKEFIHFGLTSQDINNTAIPLTLKLAYNEVIKPSITEILHNLEERAYEWKHIPMLAHTHGQPASPTSLGKEIYVFAERIKKQLEMLDKIPFSAKFGGATGNFNAHFVAYPDINWHKFADNFVYKSLKLDRSKTTTQIEHYDNLAAFFDNVKRINTILIDLDRDIWTYISMDYFTQKIVKGEVGSSTMPHKVNPIDFENSEGNLGYANAIFEHLSSKLPISRLQRDLTDSTVLRNIGVPFAHSLIAYKSLIKGLNKLIINEKEIKADLNKNWAVIAEAIQTILRRESYPEPYEALKELTRNNTHIDSKTIHAFIDSLKISSKVKKELKNITPENYIGIINL